MKQDVEIETIVEQDIDTFVREQFGDDFDEIPESGRIEGVTLYDAQGDDPGIFLVKLQLTGVEVTYE